MVLSRGGQRGRRRSRQTRHRHALAGLPKLGRILAASPLRDRDAASRDGRDSFESPPSCREPEATLAPDLHQNRSGAAHPGNFAMEEAVVTVASYILLDPPPASVAQGIRVQDPVGAPLPSDGRG